MSDIATDETASRGSIGKLALAMSKAQSEFRVAVFDKRANYGPYASFKSVRDASIEALSKNGIAVFQPVHFDGVNYFLETLLVHSSGESLSSKIKLLIDRQNMQGLGSAVTYAKRYAWASIIGVVSDDDDDGALASAPHEAPAQSRRVMNHATGEVKDMMIGAPPVAESRPVSNHPSQLFTDAELKSLESTQGTIAVTKMAKAMSEKNKAEMERVSKKPYPSDAFHPGDYVIGFGKNKGNKLKDMPLKDLRGFLVWARNQPEPGKNLLEFIEFGEQYLTVLEAELQDRDFFGQQQSILNENKI